MLTLQLHQLLKEEWEQLDLHLTNMGSTQRVLLSCLARGSQGKERKVGESMKSRNNTQRKLTLLAALAATSPKGVCSPYASVRHSCCLLLSGPRLWPCWGGLQGSSGLTEVWGRPSESDNLLV